MKKDGYIAAVTVRLWGESSEGIAEEALRVFEKHITKYAWVLRENGAIICGTTSEEKGSIAFAIDSEDSNTVKAFNLLPKYFDRKLGRDQIEKLMKFKVFVYPTPDFEYWSEEDNEDVIVFTEEGLWIESIKYSCELLAEAAQYFKKET